MSSLIALLGGETLPLVVLLAKATLLLVAALAASAWLRRATAGTRHLLWLATLAGLVALPLLGRVAPLRLAVLPEIVSSPAADVASLDLPAPEPKDVATGDASILEAAPPAPAAELAEPPAPARSLLTMLLLGWAAVAAALCAWLAIGALTVRRLLARARPLGTPDWTTPLCEVADRLDLNAVPRLVASDRIEMAFACGLLSPTIVLPASAEQWSDDRRRAVLFHELAHVRRHDLLGHALSRLACAMYWFHPLVWTAAKRLRSESERACDDLVLTCGARPSDYAQHLLEMVTAVRRHGAPAVALPMARPQEFEGRMLAILDPEVRRSAPGRLQSAGVVLSLALLSLTLSAVTPVRRTAEAAQGASASMDDPRRLDVGDASASEIAAAGIASERSSSAHANGALQSGGVAGRVAARDGATGRAMPSPDPVADAVTDAVARATATATAVETPEQERQVAQEIVKSKQGGEELDSARAAMLARILRTDQHEDVRKSAAWALARARTTEAVAALTEALRRDASADVRETAAWSLARTSNEAAASALAQALRGDASDDVRVSAGWALAHVRIPVDGEAFAAAMRDRSPEVREVSAWALGMRRTAPAPAALVAGLTDQSKDVRLVTAWALGEIRDPRTRDALVAAFQRETDSEVQEGMLRSIALLGEVPQAVIEAALASKQSDVRARAVSLLAGHGIGVWPWPWPWPWPRPSP